MTATTRAAAIDQNLPTQTNDPTVKGFSFCACIRVNVLIYLVYLLYWPTL